MYYAYWKWRNLEVAINENQWLFLTTVDIRQDK